MLHTVEINRLQGQASDLKNDLAKQRKNLQITKEEYETRIKAIDANIIDPLNVVNTAVLVRLSDIEDELKKRKADIPECLFM